MSSPGISITANVNVDSAGHAKPLPGQREIASSGFDWLCVILEVIAARLHQEIGGTTASTTTIGLLTSIGRLYITNQQNKKFEEITLDKIGTWIDELAKVDYEAFLRTMGLHHVYNLNEKDVQRLQSKKDPESKALVQAINFVYYNVYPSFVRLKHLKEQRPECFAIAKGFITSVEIITNEGLFPKGTTTTGLHGEGRFVRFLYIKYVANLKLLEIELPPRSHVRIPIPTAAFRDLQPAYGSDEDSGDASDSETQELLDIAKRYFECIDLLKGRQVNTMQIYVASSQGTCADCQDMLASLGIMHNTHRYSKESPSSNWIEPFTWRDIKSNGKPVERLFAQKFAEEEAEKMKAKMKLKRPATDSDSDSD